MRIDHFTDQRIDEIHRASPSMTKEERVFLVCNTQTFEECSFSADELAAMSDTELMHAAYATWADYAAGQI